MMALTMAKTPNSYLPKYANRKSCATSAITCKTKVRPVNTTTPRTERFFTASIDISSVGFKCSFSIN